jgi:hypothetical protein
LAEQGTENPRVGGSIPPLGIFNIGTSRSKLSDANRFKIPTVLRRTELRRSLPVRLDAVKRALQDGDASRLTEEGHKLAGVLSPFSMRAGAGLSSRTTSP